MTVDSATDTPRPSRQPDLVATPDESSRLDIALDLLVEVVGELSGSGRLPTGSEVRLALKNRTYDGFDLKSLGFRRFRDFLAGAVAQGRIEVDETRPGDVAVRLPGIASTTAVVPPAIRGDLWRAFLEWGPDELRLYDNIEDKVIRLPRTPAPLEPERFASVRRSVAEAPDRYISITPVSRTTQVDWMRQFAATRAPDLRELLEQALAGEKPSKTFVQVLRALPDERARWQEALLGHIRSRVEDWRAGAGLDISIDKRADADVQEAPPPDADADVPAVPATPRWVISTQQAPRPSTDEALSALTAIVRTQRLARHRWLDAKAARSTPDPRAESELRRRLHEAIDRMPVDELRRLVIPVGYLFEE